MRFTAVIVLSALLMGKAIGEDKPSRSAGPGNLNLAPGSRFAALAQQFIKESLVLSPVSASAAGYHIHYPQKSSLRRKTKTAEKGIALDAELDDVSPEAFARQRVFFEHWRRRFSVEKPSGKALSEDGIDLAMVQNQIDNALLELDRIQDYRHNPTLYVELVGNGIFTPLTQNYASREVRLQHVLSRIKQIPRMLQQARQTLENSDPIYIQVAAEENGGNVELIEGMVQRQVSAVPSLKKEYGTATPQALAAIRDFSRWLKEDFSRRPASRTWRLGEDLYKEKFKLVMQADVTPAQLLRDAEHEMQQVRRQMFELALEMHEKTSPGDSPHPELQGQARENLVISEVLQQISSEHPQRDQLMAYIQADVEGIKRFIREKQIVALSDRDNLKIIPTPPFMRGIYSVAGFRNAPPLEPSAEAQYWVTPIDPKTPEAQAESKLREYNNWSLKWLTIHEALPGHYIQFEHANNVQPPLRRLLRNLYGNGPYVEGWAEYIAQVMMDAGFLDFDRRYRLSMGKIRLRVVSNAILDIRMHTMGMTDKQAMDLMMNSAFQTQAEAEGKLRRAKLSSVQLPTYYVGLREWFDLRKKYEAAMGKNFRLLEFHNRALDEGAVPLPLLKKILLPR